MNEVQRPSKTHFIVHLVGHHEVYLDLRSDEAEYVALHQNFATYSLGKDWSEWIAHESGFQVEASPTGVRFDPPPKLGTSARQLGRLEFRPSLPASLDEPLEVVGLRFPIISAALRSVISAASPEDTIVLQVLTSGPTEKHPDRGKATHSIGDALVETLRRFPPDRRLHVRPPLPWVTMTPHDFTGVPALVREVSEILAAQRLESWTDIDKPWGAQFQVYLSLNTGPLPVIGGIQHGLVAFKPSLINYAAAKRWHGADNDEPPSCEVLDFDKLRQVPEFDANDPRLSAPVRRAVDEMRRWRQDFEAARPRRPSPETSRHDEHFWFRKGTKEVLAVVIVKRGEALHAIRGVNLEVSLPTGTLCAERNAIGSALAQFPDLKRREIAAVAVLALKEGSAARLGPCGACVEWIGKVAEVNPDVCVVTFATLDMDRVHVEAVEAS